MAGLEFLASHQAENGQIPNFVAPDTGETDFWYLGCIDATLWWLAAVAFWSRHLPEDCVEERFRGGAEPVTRYLEAEVARTRARAALAAARIDVERASVELARALGRLATPAAPDGGAE